MQSYLQYRRIGQVVRKQFADHPEWGQRVQGESTDPSGNTSENDETVWEKRSESRPLALPQAYNVETLQTAAGRPRQSSW